MWLCYSFEVELISFVSVHIHFRFLFSPLALSLACCPSQLCTKVYSEMCPPFPVLSTLYLPMLWVIIFITFWFNYPFLKKILLIKKKNIAEYGFGFSLFYGHNIDKVVFLLRNIITVVTVS